MSSTVFTTPRLRVRLIRQDDFDHFYRMHSNPEVMRYIQPVKNRAESDAFVENALQGFDQPSLGRWVAEEMETGRVIGTFVIVPSREFEGTINLGYLLLPEYWGKGYATELVRGGLAYFFDRTDYPEIFAVIESENQASRRVLEKSGFRYHDQYPEGAKTLWRYRQQRPIT
jgi:RimJ/RimL family protein N-acetyltransferase